MSGDKNDASQAAYNNADWKILLRQDRKNLEKLIEDGLVTFSPAVKRMLLSLHTEKGKRRTRTVLTVRA